MSLPSGAESGLPTRFAGINYHLLVQAHAEPGLDIYVSGGRPNDTLAILSPETEEDLVIHEHPSPAIFHGDTDYTLSSRTGDGVLAIVLGEYQPSESTETSQARPTEQGHGDPTLHLRGLWLETRGAVSLAGTPEYPITVGYLAIRANRVDLKHVHVDKSTNIRVPHPDRFDQSGFRTSILHLTDTRQNERP